MNTPIATKMLDGLHLVTEEYKEVGGPRSRSHSIATVGATMLT